MKILLSHGATRELDRLPDQLVLRIHKKLSHLSNNPYGLGSQKLEGGKGYRIRIGDYRVVYTIDTEKQILLIIKVRHRKDVYK